MRELKFRVWSVKNNCFVTNGCSMSVLLSLEYEGTINSKDIYQQYTGLTDSKGNHIYEGDIIKEHHFEDWGDKIGYEYIGIVVYKEYSDDILYAGYKTIPAKNQNTKFRGNAIQSDCEVIGNVFENSELLK
jgi:uncharacterized phage protein (TIGR01671 family)